MRDEVDLILQRYDAAGGSGCRRTGDDVAERFVLAILGQELFPIGPTERGKRVSRSAEDCRGSHTHSGSRRILSCRAGLKGRS